MRTNILVAAVLLGVSFIAAVILVACSDSTTACKDKTLTLQVELSGTANFADTITVSSSDPAAMLTQTFAHEAGGEHLFTVDVTFPGGYPADKAVTFLVRATGATTLLGENVATIHLGQTCATGYVSIRSTTLDASTVD